MYYLRARYYNPYIGRFISEDSYWGEDTNPLSLNLYTYGHNNPIKFVDPTGHYVSDWDKQNVTDSKDMKKLEQNTKDWDLVEKASKEANANQALRRK